MTIQTKGTTPALSVEISPDCMKAWLIVGDITRIRSANSADVIQILKDSEIVVDDSVSDRIDPFLATMREETPPCKSLIAEGRPPVDGKDGDFQRHESIEHEAQDWQGDAPVNYYEFNSIHTVKEGDLLGTIIPADPGTAGVDVFGKSVEPRYRGREVELGEGVETCNDDPLKVNANCSGRVFFGDGKLSIKEEYRVEEDVDFGTGNIDSSVDVRVPGTIRDRFKVKSEGAITVGGAIEAAAVETECDLTVRGGILGRQSASIRVGGNLVARFCDEADLNVKGDMKISRELMNCHVRCDGILLATYGAIIGGTIYGREGVEASSLGSDAGIRTEISIGIHPDVIVKAEQLRESIKPKRETIDQIRTGLQPLMAEMKRLTASQKERATELMFQADTLEAEIAEIEQQREEMLKAARATGTPYVLVSRIIYPKTAIRIGRRQTLFNELMHGPIKIEKRKIKSVTEFVAVNQLSGSIRILQSAYAVMRAPAEAPVSEENQDSSSHGSRG
ncbi:MAG: DUF342 domain-containing protein [Phycisphaerae bacterium]